MIRACIVATALVIAIPVVIMAETLGEGSGAVGKTYRSLLTVWGGYTTLSMQDVNNDLGASAGGGSATKIVAGYDFGADFLYELWPRFFAGVRAAYIGPNQGKASSAGTSQTRDLYLVPVMAGGRYYFMDKKSDWNVSAAAFAGIGTGYGKTRSTVFSSGSETKYGGSGFVAEILAGGEYKLSEMIRLGLDAGYRYAPIPNMSLDTGSGGGGGGGYSPLRKASITDSSGNTLKFDFSGFFANLCLHFKI